MSRRSIEQKYVTQKKLVVRQITEIEELKAKISELEIDCQKKDEIINSVDRLRIELDTVVSDLRAKHEEYNNLISEVREMRNAINRAMFGGRWKLIKLLLK